MEMTDVEGKENQVAGTSDKELATDRRGSERWGSVQKGLGTLRLHQMEHRSSLTNVEGDFEEFVLDFDDYDLLESIHTQMGSPEEPICKLCVKIHLYSCWVALHFCSFNEEL